jgi:hypothetical protein
LYGIVGDLGLTALYRLCSSSLVGFTAFEKTSGRVGLTAF